MGFIIKNSWSGCHVTYRFFTENDSIWNLNYFFPAGNSRQFGWFAQEQMVSFPPFKELFFDLFTIKLWLHQSPFPCDQQNKNCLKCSKQSRCHPDSSFFECGLNFKCDPLTQQGPEVAGDNTSYRQTSEGQMVFHSTVPLQLTTTTFLSF